MRLPFFHEPSQSPEHIAASCLGQCLHSCMYWNSRHLNSDPLSNRKNKADLIYKIFLLFLNLLVSLRNDKKISWSVVSKKKLRLKCRVFSISMETFVHEAIVSLTIVTLVCNHVKYLFSSSPQHIWGKCVHFDKVCILLLQLYRIYLFLHVENQFYV